jgi:DNA-binding MarR family transcriptional regulator
MSSRASNTPWPPLPIGALLRFALDEIRRRIYDGVVAGGFDDLRPAHVTLFRWPGPEGRRPTEVAADVQLSKQRVNDLLRDLEQLGYLRLEPDPTDSRARIVRLTKRGHALHRLAVAIHDGIEREWAGIVGERSYRELGGTLNRLVIALPGTQA